MPKKHFWVANFTPLQYQNAGCEATPNTIKLRNDFPMLMPQNTSEYFCASLLTPPQNISCDYGWKNV